MRGNPVQVGYARVSAIHQDLDLQLDALERAGVHPSNIHAEKKSGAAGKDRPVRDELLRQLEPGDVLAVWKIDRLGRSLAELLDIIKNLEARRITFRCVTQPVDTSTSAGKLFLQLLAAFAEFEREMILERTAAGHARRQAKGLPHGRPRMFGTVGMGPTAVDPAKAEAEAELLGEAARRVLDGEPLSRIVEDWNDRGIATVKGGSWGVSSLRRVLKHPQTETIVGAATFRQLARVFDNRGNQRQKLGAPTEHLLSGILVCGRPDCGQPLYWTWKQARNGTREEYYRCKPGRGSGNRFHGCGSTGIAMARANVWAEEAFVAAVTSDDFVQALNRRQAELLAGDMTTDRLDDMRADIAELEQVLPTRYAPPDAAERLARLQRQVREATARLLAQPELQAMIDLPKSEAALRALWATEVDGTPAPGSWSIGERRTWLRRVFSSITVKPATTPGRGSVVEDRLVPQWKV
jgi:DNA invertase Pin-like site-specific DNA recombinase